MAPLMRILALSPVLCALGCGGALCDADALTETLSSASPGDVVQLGACEIRGTFEVPAGVQLLGVQGSTIRHDGLHTLDVFPGTSQMPTRIQGLTVLSEAIGGIVINGDGAVQIEQVRVESTRGVGIFASDLSALSLVDVTLRGAVNASNISMFVSQDPTVETAPTHGLVIRSIQNATIESLSVRGYLKYGALLQDSITSWRRGDASENVDVGIMVLGGNAILNELEVSRSVENTLGTAPPPIAIVTATATVDSTDLVLEDNEGFGLVQFGGGAEHRNVSINRNLNGGVWVQNALDFMLSGNLEENLFVGVAAVESTNVVLEDTQILNTTEEFGMRTQEPLTRFGDGLQLIDSLQGAALRRLAFNGNGRTALIVELNGQPLPAGLFNDVQIMRSNTQQKGAIVQGGMRAMDWDNGLNRDSATVQTDNAQMTPLAVVQTFPLPPVGAVGPCF